MAEQTITTTAVGRTSAAPDQVELRFAARAVEPDLTAARQAVADQASRLRQSLDTAGIPTDRVRTSQFRIGQRPPDRGQPGQGERERESRPYQATELVSVTVLDRDRLGAVLSSAVEEAGVEIDAVSFTFRPETQRELQCDALADAVATARRKATAAAAAEDLTVAEVRSIVTDDGSRPRRTSAGQQLAADTSEAGSVESGPIDVRVRAEVEYRLSDA